MIDTLNFYLDLKEMDKTTFSKLMQRISITKQNIFHDRYGMEYVDFHGNIGYLKVILCKSRIFIKDRSICKWIKGDNLHTLARENIKNGIDRLSDILHLPMDQAKVSRLDLGQNFIVQQPVENYLSHMGILSRAKRLCQFHGLYYNKTNLQLIFYDKLKEYKQSNDKMPEQYNNKYMLRYELRLLQKLSSLLKVPEVTTGLLYNKDFYVNLVKLWHNYYKAIQKINDIDLNFDAIKNKGDLHRTAILNLLKDHGGEIEVTDQIDEALKCKKLTSKQTCDLKAIIIKASEIKKGFVTPNKEIEELNQKIDDFVSDEIS
jgi:hypothetical protein